MIVKRLEPMLGRLLGEDVALVTVTPPEPVKVMADPSQIEQVIVNLALNARDAMPDGGVLTIETAALDVDAAAAATQPDARSGPTAQLSVSDTGMGMDPDTLTHLFEPFVTTKSQGKGTGLGLATVYGIVRQSGGVVWPRSQLGAGSTLTVWLPLTAGRPAALAAQSAGPIEPKGKTGGTIVVVEDDAGVRRFATQVLERAGYTVVAAATGAVALRTEVSDGMDLLLTDVVMPTMSGREVADRLSAAHPGLRVLFMSGHADSTIVKHGVLDGSIRYLPKPFTAEVLLAAVHDALTNPVNPAA